MWGSGRDLPLRTWNSRLECLQLLRWGNTLYCRSLIFKKKIWKALKQYIIKIKKRWKNSGLKMTTTHKLLLKSPSPSWSASCIVTLVLSDYPDQTLPRLCTYSILFYRIDSYCTCFGSTFNWTSIDLSLVPFGIARNSRGAHRERQPPKV